MCEITNFRFKSISILSISMQTEDAKFFFFGVALFWFNSVLGRNHDGIFSFIFKFDLHKITELGYVLDLCVLSVLLSFFFVEMSSDVCCVCMCVCMSVFVLCARNRCSNRLDGNYSWPTGNTFS